MVGLPVCAGRLNSGVELVSSVRLELTRVLHVEVFAVAHKFGDLAFEVFHGGFDMGFFAKMKGVVEFGVVGDELFVADVQGLAYHFPLNVRTESMPLGKV